MDGIVHPWPTPVHTLVQESTLGLPCIGSAVQENSPHPWPTSNPTLRDIRPTMALPSCIGRGGGGRRTGERGVYGRRAISGKPEIALPCLPGSPLAGQNNECWTLARRSCLDSQLEIASDNGTRALWGCGYALSYDNRASFHIVRGLQRNCNGTS